MAQLRTFQSNMSGGELAPAMYSRTDVSKYVSGLKLARNVTIKPQGGVRFRNGFEFVGEVVDSTLKSELVPFNVGIGESYVLEFVDERVFFIREGAYILSSTSATITSVSAANPAVFTTSAAHGFSNGDLVFVELAGGDGPLITNRYLYVANVTSTTFTLVDEWGAAVASDVVLSNGGTATPRYSIATPYATGTSLNYAQDQNLLYLFSHDYPPQVLTRTTPSNWAIAPLNIGPEVKQPTSVTALALVGSGSTLYTYRVSSIAKNTGEESRPSATTGITNDLTIAGNSNRISWSPPSQVTGGEIVSRYKVYKLENGVFGYIGGTTGTQFVDNNIIPDLSDTPQPETAENPFNGANLYPRVGTFFEQRLFLANSRSIPNGVWASQSANSRNFNFGSPLKASDALSFRIRASQVAEIEALIPTRALLMMTSGGEWTVTGGDNQDYLTPTNIVLRQQAFRGSDPVQPLLIGDMVMHAQRGGGAIRDFLLSRETPSTEISLLARHLFRDRTIVAWGYAQSPDSIVWVVLDNGDLLALTYMLEHEIWGWTKMEFTGDTAIEDVAIVNEGAFDAVYVLARRTINGVQKRHIWRLRIGEPTVAADAFHVDAGLSATFETPTSAIAGFSHLEGETLVGVVDGNVVRDLVVTDGVVVLPVEGSNISLGLSYTGRIKTLDLDLGPMREIGTILGRYKAISEVTLQVEDTRGVFVAHENDQDMVEYRQRAEEDWNEAISLFTGPITITPYAEWSKGGGLVIEQRDPLPMTINGILIDWELGE